MANPHDILLWSKAAKRRAAAAAAGGAGGEGEGGSLLGDGGLLRPEELNQQNIEALLNESDLVSGRACSAYGVNARRVHWSHGLGYTGS